MILNKQPKLNETQDTFEYKDIGDLTPLAENSAIGDDDLTPIGHLQPTFDMTKQQHLTLNSPQAYTQ